MYDKFIEMMLSNMDKGNNKLSNSVKIVEVQKKNKKNKEKKVHNEE